MLVGAGTAVSEHRLLLFGGSGRLGSALQREAGPGWTVIAPTRADLDLARVEVRDLQTWIKASAPQVVLNAAAMAWVDACEEDPEGANRLNAYFPDVLAKACALEVIPLVHISTDYVFGDEALGDGAPYSEESRTCPVQIYGVSKAKGEAAVLSSEGRSCVVRISWLTEPGEGSFVRYLLAQVRSGKKEVAVLRDQKTRPTMARGLCRWLLGLIKLLAAGSTVPGILHPAGCEPVSRGEWAEGILASLGYEGLEVIDDPGTAGGPDYTVQGATQCALRPVDSSLDARFTMNWSRDQGLPVLEDWRKVLADKVS